MSFRTYLYFTQNIYFIRLITILAEHKRHLPFPWAKFRRSCSVLGSGGNVSDPQRCQGIFLLPFISQGGGAQVQYQIQAVQKAPGSQELKVLIMLSKHKPGSQMCPTLLSCYMYILCVKQYFYLSSSSARVTDGLSNHLIDFQLLKK